MKYVLTSIVCCICCAMSFISCDPDKDSAGPNVLKGNLHGQVNLPGTTVSIDGTSFTTVADSNGSFVFNDLSAGTYILTYSKSGYGTMKEFGVEFVGGGDAYHAAMSLSRIPTDSVFSLTTSDTVYSQSQYDSTGKIIVTSYPGVNCRATVRAGYNNFRDQVYLFMNTGDTVGIAPGMYTYSTEISKINIGYPDSVNFERLLLFSYQYRIPKGTKLTLAAYVVALNNTGYHDPTTGFDLFTAINPKPSNVIHCVVQ